MWPLSLNYFLTIFTKILGQLHHLKCTKIKCGNNAQILVQLASSTKVHPTSLAYTTKNYAKLFYIILSTVHQQDQSKFTGTKATCKNDDEIDPGI